MPIDLHLPWTVDADEAAPDKFSGEIVVTDHASSIPFTCSFDPKDPSSQEAARQRALVICRRFNEDLPDEKVRFWLFACTVEREGFPSRYTPIPGIEPFLVDLKRAHCDQRESNAVHGYLMRRAAALGFLKAEIVWKDYADMYWTGDPA